MSLNDEVAMKVKALQFELGQVKDHPVLQFRERAAEIEKEIAEWLSGDAPTAPAPSDTAPAADAPAEPAKSDAKAS